jgi:hypothetical protein
MSLTGVGDNEIGKIIRQLVRAQQDVLLEAVKRENGILLEAVKKEHGTLLQKLVENQGKRFGKMPLFGIDVSFLYQTL